MATTELALPDTKEVDSRALSLLEQAQGAEINTREDLDYWSGFLKDLKAIQADIDSTFDPVVKSAHAAWKTAVDAKKKHSVPVEEAERVVKGRIGGYLQAEDARIRKERVEAEAVAKKQAEDARIAQAEALMKAGRKQEAERALSAPVMAAVPPPVAAPKVDGISTRQSWRAEVVDVIALVRYVAANPEWVGLLKVDQTALNQLARAQKENLKLPGVVARTESGVAVRI
jgi:hypothetical protein